MNNNYIISYKTADNEIGMINVTGEDHVDAEATFHMIADENNWAIEEVMSVSTVLEITDEEMQQWDDFELQLEYMSGMYGE